jgi:glycosyltransferase involved in cell wall biosynthesis
MVDVSVVIATHNRALLVKEAIDSVLAQTQPPREVIVVDDGSSDPTRETLASYGNRIRAFHQKQGGASAARNFGMSRAEGEWIAFLDDDDVWLPSKLEQQVKLLEQDRRLGLVYCSDYTVDDHLRILHSRVAAPANRGDVFERLLIRNFIFTSCVVARRDAIQRAGYMDLEFRFAQDWDLWLKIAAHAPVDFVPEPLVLYRHSASGCLTRDMKTAERVGEIQTIFERALRLRGVPDEVQRRARYELEIQWASNWLAEGRNHRALPHSLRAVLSKPSSLESHRLLIYSLVPKTVREMAKQVAGRK